MKICLRVDSSNSIGTGHVTRCLTLAEELKRRGSNILFICRAHLGNMIDLLQRHAMPVAVLPPPAQLLPRFNENYAEWLGVSQKDDAIQTAEVIAKEQADWLVVDHYGLDAEWEGIISRNVLKMMVIDDLANRKHVCDLLLDQNYVRDSDIRYMGLVPDNCRLLLGPQYALLRPEYQNYNKSFRYKTRDIQNILIYFGGSDLHDMTGLTLEALCAPEFKEIQIDIVVGRNYPYLGLLEEKAKERPKTLLHGPYPYLTDLMRDTDLAIGAGGATTWERLCMGVPSLVVCIAHNQKLVCESLANENLIEYLGEIPDIDCTTIRANIRRVISEPQILVELSVKGQQLVDGYGTSRICEYLDQQR